MYSVKEIFYSLQGEGLHGGRPAVFCRFSGCNLWSGREKDRATSVCPFCDTDFVGTNGQNGGKYPGAAELAEKIHSLWPETELTSNPYVVFTGGEPLLQLDRILIDQMHHWGFEVAVETNGSIAAEPAVIEGIDWLCVSPKADMELKINRGNELKLLYPQEKIQPESYEKLNFDYFFLQPIDDPQHRSNQQQTLSYCLRHPQWRYSVQLHKLLQID